MLWAQVKNYRVILGVVIAYCLYGFLMATHYNLTNTGGGVTYTVMDYVAKFLSRLCIMTFFVLVTLILKIMIIDRPKRLIKRIYTDFRYIYLKPDFLCRGILMIISLYFFISSFSAMKTLIPVLNPFGSWDDTFREMDKFLFFGYAPWELTHAVFAHPIFSLIINVFYNLWFFVLYAVFATMAFLHTDEYNKKSYFLSFYLCWIINGTILATLLSSVGPCFYDLIYNIENGPYAPLMDRLYAIHESYPLWALAIQEKLWMYYQNEKLFLGAGISAMPSLHVSIALLQVFIGYKISRSAGHILLAFFFIIMIGSVHLGWHYAVDGLLSIITTTVIWYGSRWLLRHEKDTYSLGHNQAAPRTPEESP